MCSSDLPRAGGVLGVGAHVEVEAGATAGEGVGGAGAGDDGLEQEARDAVGVQANIR